MNARPWRVTLAAAALMALIVDGRGSFDLDRLGAARLIAGGGWGWAAA